MSTMLQRDLSRAYVLSESVLDNDDPQANLHPKFQKLSPFLEQTRDGDSETSPTPLTLDLDSTNLREPLLPPTPPPRTNGPYAFQPSSKASSVGSRTSGFVTPTNPKSPPTPDETPPRLQEILTKLSSSSFPALSSYAESFKTALEDQRSIHTVESEEALAEIIYQNDTHFPPLPNSPRAATFADVFKSMDEPIVMPKAVPLRHKPDFYDLAVINERKNEFRLYRNSSPVWGNGTFGNGGVLSRTPPISLAQDNPRASQMRSLDTRKDNDTMIGVEQLPNGHDWAKGTPDPTTPHELDVKRLSGASTASTVVEAVVIDHTPPPSKQKLRHVSKTDSLRNSASPQSNRNLFEPAAAPSVISSPNISLNGFSKPHNSISNSSTIERSHSLKRQKATISLGVASDKQGYVPRPVTAPQSTGVINFEQANAEAQDQRRVVSDPLQVRPLSMEDVTPPPPSASPASLVQEYSFDDAMSVQQVSSSKEDGATTNRLSMADSYQSRASSDQQAKNEIQAELGSIVSLNSQDVSTTREIYGASPMSLKSETTEHFEINEAAAIKLSSHTNDSLLVVHHTNSNDGIHRRTVAGPEISSPKAEEGTFITIEPSSPIDTTHFDRVPLSPLRNPRAAPEPPSLAVAFRSSPPPIDVSIEEPNSYLSSGPQPAAQGSLFTRARRYSESFIHPFTGGFRLNRYGSGKRQIGSISRQPQANEASRHIQPQANSEDWVNEPVDSREPELIDQAPGASEVMDLHEDREIHHYDGKWQRMGSVRGFLIGNSLGLERGPTNKRRHRVILPNRGTHGSKSYANYRPGDNHVTVRQSAKRSGLDRNKLQSHRGKAVFRSWRERMKQRKMRRKQKQQDKKRAALRDSIEGPFEHVSTATRAF